MSSQGSKTPSRQQTPQASVGSRIKGWFSGLQCPLKSCPLRKCKCCGYVQQHKLGVIIGLVAFVAYIALCAFLDCHEKNSTTTETTTTEATPEPTTAPADDSTNDKNDDASNGEVLNDNQNTNVQNDTPQEEVTPTPEPTPEPTAEPAQETVEKPQKTDL